MSLGRINWRGLLIADIVWGRTLLNEASCLLDIVIVFSLLEMEISFLSYFCSLVYVFSHSFVKACMQILDMRG